MNGNQTSLIKDSSKRATKSAIIITLTYVILASLWIIFSDRIGEQFFQDTDDGNLLQTYKGLGFVLVTASALFGLLFRYFRQLIAHDNQLRGQGKRLQESEALYRNLVENSSDLIWSIDAEWRIKFINEASRVIYGREPDEMIGRRYTDFIPGDQIDLNAESWEVALGNDDRIRDFENWVLHKDGHAVLLSANAILLRDAQGEIIGATGISRDITQQKANEEKIRLQANLLSAVQQGVIATDMDGKIIYWNQYAEQMYGWSAEDVIGQDIVTITVPRLSQKQSLEIMNTVRETGKWSGQFTVLRKDGSEFPVLATNSLYYDDNHESAGIIGLSLDITERKEAESLLAATNNRLRAIFEASPAAIIIFDDERKVKQWNPAAERIFGWPEEEVLGRNIPIIFDDKWDQFDRNLARLKLHGGESDVQVQCKCKDNTLIDLSLSTARFEGPDDERYYMALYIDITERLKVTKQLEQTSALLKQTFTSLTEAVFVIDATDRTVVTCNSAVGQILGYTPEEIIGKNTKFLHVDPESYREFAVLGDKALEKEGIFSTEYRMKHKDGRIIDTAHTVALLYPGLGLRAGAVSVIRDITERKQSRLQLEASEARYHQLFEYAPVMIMEQDFSKMKQYLDELRVSEAGEDGLNAYLQIHPEAIDQCLSLVSMLDVNQTGVEMFGANSKQQLLSQMSKIIQPDDEVMRRAQLESLMAVHASKQIFQGEFANQTLQGERIEFLIRWIVLPGYEATYERVLVTAIDITARKQVENELRKTLERERELRSQANLLRLLAESLVLTTELDTALKTAINLFEDIVQFDLMTLFSIERNHLVPIIQDGMLDSETVEKGRDYTQSSLLLQSLTKGHMLRASSTNDKVDLLHQLVNIPDTAKGWVVIPLISRGITMGLVSVSRLDREFNDEEVRLVEGFSYQIASALDNSRVHQDLQQSYQQLQLAQEKMVQAARLAAIGELAAGVAHQINNPLMTVIADSYLILKNVETDSPLRESVEAISRAAYKAGSIVQRLLDFAKTTPGSMKDVDINDSLQQTINLLRPQIEPRYAELQIDFPDTLPAVYGSEDHLQDVWMNLLLNARDAVRDVEDGRIIVKTEFDEQKNVIQVTIKDNGMGIDNDQVDQIFDPFFTTKESGTGLGLAICADIIKQHQGTITVKSQPDKGTRFIIELPIENSLV